MLDEFDRLRERQARILSGLSVGQVGGAAAFVGRITTVQSLIAAGKYLLVHPVESFFTESEGSSGSLVVNTSVSQAVLLLGPNVPSTGDDVICRRVGNRWVTDMTRTPGPCTVGGTWIGCNSPTPYPPGNAWYGYGPLPGVSVVMTESGTVVASTMTDVHGGWRLTFPHSGTFVVTSTLTGYCTDVTPYTVVCPRTIIPSGPALLALNTLPVLPLGCQGTNGATYHPIAGAVVTVKDSGGTLYGSACTTDGTNPCVVSVPCTYPYTVYISTPRFADFSQTISGPGVCAIYPQLVPDSTHVCIPCCDAPLAKTLHATSAIYGAVTLTWTSGYTWVGTKVSGGVTITFTLQTTFTTSCYGGPLWTFSESSPSTLLGQGHGTGFSCPPGFSLSFPDLNLGAFGFPGGNHDSVGLLE